MRAIRVFEKSVLAARQLDDRFVDQGGSAAGADLLAQQRTGGAQRHVDGGVAHLLGSGRFRLGDTVQRLLFAQRNLVLQALRGSARMLSASAVAWARVFSASALAFMASSRRREASVSALVMSAARLSSRAAILDHRILPSATTKMTNATATQVSGSAQMLPCSAAAA
jgi:hypothetical protein